jgi:hypothetical protein
MDKKRYILHVTKQLLKRSREPTVEDKPFLRSVWLSLGGFMVSICVVLLTGLSPFSLWLMYGAIITEIAACLVLIVWRIRDIIKQMKEKDRGS